MSTVLRIEIELSDEQDFDWLRNKCVAAVEDEVGLAVDDDRLDGTASVSWEEVAA